MPGTLGLVSLSRLKNVPTTDYDKRLFTVREPKSVDYKKYGLIHTPQLSPSPALFESFHKRWKYGKFTPEEQRQMDAIPDGTWWNLYAPRFLYEMEARTDMQKALTRVEELLNQGEDVLFICFCTDETHCHRGMLGDSFRKKGYDVKSY